MGWGDEIMATADARRIHEASGKRRLVAMRGKDGRARWHSIFDNNPRLVRPVLLPPGAELSVDWCENYSGHRPYLDYSRFRNSDKRQPYVYTSWRASPGEIYLTPAEVEFGRAAAGATILEPNVKPGASPNKDWTWQRWRRLAGLLPGRLVQLGPPGTKRLDGVDWIPTPTIRHAAAAIAASKLLIVPEGGLHHCAAALGRRAVVIFGGFISPATTGYDLHRNFFTGGQACGMRVPCFHCADAMARISPEEVATAARELLMIKEEA